MKNNDSTNPGLPLWPDANSETSAADISSYEQKLARIRDMRAMREVHLLKSMKRAHKIVGQIIMDDLTLRKLVAPHLEKRLGDLGPARKAVEEYDRSRAELAKLKSLRL